MNILITGGAGYIGSNLVALLLKQGHNVRVLDSLLHGGHSLLSVWSDPGFEFIAGDIRDRGIVTEAVQSMDAVVHLAALVGDPACARDPDNAIQVNLEGSRLVLQESRNSGVRRFIFASTCSNYGQMSNTNLLADETWQLNPISVYAESKVAFEESILDLQIDNFSPTVLRFATVYGVSPRMRFDLTVNEFTMDLLTKGKLEVFGEQFWRPYIHVRDVGTAISLVLNGPLEVVANEVFNVGSSEQNYQKSQLVDLITPFAPAAIIDYVKRAEDPRDYKVSFDKIYDALTFKANYTVPDGIAEVVKLVNSGIIKDFSNPYYRN